MRYVLPIVALLVVLGSLAGVKAAQIGSMIKHGEKAAAQGPPPETVATAVAKEETWQGSIAEVGSVAASRGVTLSNLSAGRVTRIHFESGATVKEGAPIVELDTEVERSQLASAIARRDLADTTARRTRALFATGAISPAQRDADDSALAVAEKDVATIQAEIANKNVRAPFAGKLGIRAVNVGQYLAAGTPIAALESVKEVFVDFSSPQEGLGALEIGMPVRITLSLSNDKGGDAGAEAGAKESQERMGAIAAIDPVVDVATRTARVRTKLSNEDEWLRPGMFVNVEVQLRDKANVVIVPATAIVHASFGDSVFIVEDKPPNAPGMRNTPDGKPVRIARQQFVRTGRSRGDFVAIHEGLKPAQEIVTAGGFKLRNGAPVVVDNSVQSKPELAPRPENR